MYAPRLIIFTDGSINHDNSVAGSAAIIYDAKNLTRDEYSKTTKKGTNNIGELRGIEIAFKKVGNYSYDTDILIVSDSKYSIQAIERFIKYFNKNIRNDKVDPYKDTWRKKDKKKEAYKNQDIIKRIHKDFISLRTNVRYVHINSHLSIKKTKDVNRVIEKFAKQGLKINKDTAKSLILGNKEADKLAGEVCRG